MTMNKIGVAVIGASPLTPGWAMTAHIPAILALPDFELRALGTSRRESADAAAQMFGVPAYHEHHALLERSDVDLVVVAVNIIHHQHLVDAALDAGKMVFSEWPLGRNLREAEDIARRASIAGVRTAIGLQARYHPAVRHARELVAEGYIGEVLATTIVGSGIAWSGVTDQSHAYMFDRANGANTLTVPMLHALDAVNFVLGDFATVSASMAVRRPTVQISGGAVKSVTAPDHIALSGTLTTGAIVSTFYRGGVSRGNNLYWEINGSEGDLVLSSSVGNLQVADLELTGGRGDETGVHAIELPAAYANEPAGLSDTPGANVLREYTQLAHDIREGTHLVPDFNYALQRHRLIAAIEESARTGITADLDARYD